MFDISTHIVASHNETLDWCERISRENEWSVYRPHVGILQGRNAKLHEIMHYTSTTPEF